MPCRLVCQSHASNIACSRDENIACSRDERGLFDRQSERKSVALGQAYSIANSVSDSDNTYERWLTLTRITCPKTREGKEWSTT
jgi:hypothetical protein